MVRHAPPAAPSAIRPLGRPRAYERPAIVELAGYRLVRRLGETPEVATWLARGGDDSVVLRVFREAATDARIDAELQARERLIGRHVPRLLDIATGPSGLPIGVVTAIVGPLLSDVLAASTGHLRAGHLTTLLAPIAALVEAAHESGTTAGDLSTRAIRIDAEGAPVLVSLGAATASAALPARFRSHEPGILADRAALDALADELCARVEPSEQEAVRRALDVGRGHPERLELALFDCAAPFPVSDLGRGPTAPAPGGPAGARLDDRSARLTELRLAPATRPRADSRAESPSRSAPSAVGVWEQRGRALGLPERLLEPLDEGAARVALLLSRIPELRPRRRPRDAGVPDARGVERPRRGVVIAGLGGALALVMAVVLVVSEQEEPASAPVLGPPSTAPSSAPPPADEQSDPPAAAIDVVEDPADEQWGELGGLLVDRWLACAAAPTPECSAATVQGDSSAAEQLAGPPEGRAAVTEVLSAWASGERNLVVVDRQGGAVVIDLLEGETTTASLLVMRSEAGWRLRAVSPRAAG